MKTATRVDTEMTKIAFEDGNGDKVSTPVLFDMYCSNTFFALKLIFFMQNRVLCNSPKSITMVFLREFNEDHMIVTFAFHVKPVKLRKRFSGVLPPELVSIISAFAKPRLRYPDEYRAALEWNGVREWPELMKKLMGEEVIDVLRKYLALKEEARLAKREHNMSNEFRLIRPVADAYENLLIAVYGKPAPGEVLPWAWWQPYSDLWKPMDYEEEESEDEEEADDYDY